MDLIPVLATFAVTALVMYLLIRATYRSTFVPREHLEDARRLQQEAQTALRIAEEKLSHQEAAASALQDRTAAQDVQLAARLARIAALETELSAQQRMLDHHVARLDKETETNKAQQEDLHRQHGELVHLKAQHEAVLSRMADHKAEMDALRQQTRIEFEHMAQKIFTEKTTAFTQLSKDNLETILKPLSENIDGFRKKVEETYDRESKERFSLEAKVKELVESTARISHDANNLAAALKGQSKVQGDWGETVLERILEQSGLTRDREYVIQAAMRSDEGQWLRPDVLVRLPDDRDIIIDAKVSLNAYARYHAADSEAVRDIAIQQHLQSMRTHVDQLGGKQYETLANSLDFVVMFVPVEPAYLLAIHKDPDLWAYAYARRVLMVSPTNLIAVLKIVADLWKREHQNRNALEIARQGEKLLDKFHGFAETLEDVGRHIDRSHDAYAKAMKQLREGRGNLAEQARKLRALGIKSAKPVPEALRPAHDEPDPDESGSTELQ